MVIGWLSDAYRMAIGSLPDACRFASVRLSDGYRFDDDDMTVTRPCQTERDIARPV